MFGGFFRVFGLLFLAVGFIFLVYDGARSIADQALRMTRLEQTWSEINQASLEALKSAVSIRSGGWAWVYVAEPLLRQPTFVIFGVIGLVLLLLFRQRKQLIGYGRE